MSIPTPSNIRGHRSETMVENALQQLQQKGQPGLFPSPIESIIHAKPHSHLDRCKVDLLTILRNGSKIPIQVKSSIRSGKKFLRKLEECRRRGMRLLYDNIILIVVEATDTVLTVMAKLEREIQHFLEHAILDKAQSINRARPTKKRSHLMHRQTHRCTFHSG